MIHHDIHNINDYLYHISDSMYKQRVSLEALKLQYPNELELLNILIRRSTNPMIRNMSRPIGERYVPIYYDSDCFLKLNIKRWGFIPTLTVWDLLIIDIDSLDLQTIKGNIYESYPNELFYIHKTPRGYHLFLMSKPIKYSSYEALQYRIDLGCDPSYGVFSLYNGSSIRLARKKGDTERPSIKIDEIGNGSVDADTLRLYQKCIKFIESFQDEDGGAFSELAMEKLWKLWESTVKSNDNFGLVHVAVTAPMLLSVKEDKVRINYLLESSKELVNIWKDFQNNPIISLTNLDDLLKAAKCIKQNNNLYRIFSATDDYAVGMHVQEALYFISYRDLLVLDYDNNDDIENVYKYHKLHPELVFRIVKTHRGHHVFLTSHPMEHNTDEALNLQLELKSDNCYILSCYHRGYSVRINRKHSNEYEYTETSILGDIQNENQRLLQLYQKHFNLYREYGNKETYLCMRNHSYEYMKKFLMSNESYLKYPFVLRSDSPKCLQSSNIFAFM